MDYDLSRLGTREFEHLAQALCARVFGAGVDTFGDGADGGRETTFDGPIAWSADPAGPTWNGYTVVQSKYRQRPRDPADNLSWLVRQLETELAHWTDSRYKRAHQARRPNNLLVVTNVVLSPADGGGIDSVNAVIAELSDKHKLVLEGWKVWHYDQLRVLLDTHPDIRKTYGGYLTTGDVLARLEDVLGGDRPGLVELGEALRRHAVRDLIGQQWVRLGQAGHSEDERVALGQVAIDLPAQLTGPIDETEDTDSTSHVAAGAFIVARGERVLNHGLHPDQPAHLLLVGGAGQGKSTLGQLVCQAYRVALLHDQDAVGAEAARLLPALTSAFERIGMPLPKHRRWPIRVDLSEYGDAIAGGEHVSLLRFIASRVTSRSPIPVTAAQLQSWLAHWPWLLVLDGLDEIATPSVRANVTSGVSDFLVDAAACRADVLIVVTTRPQGYAGEFGAHDYQRLDLQPLDAETAIECATRLGEQRLRDDDDLREKVRRRIVEAAEERESSRLLKTPLQVAIMHLLLERMQRAPHDRYQLFDAYFSAIYAREQNKPGAVGKLLENHRADIVAVHEQLALRLQKQAEQQGPHEASVPTSVLHELASSRLMTEGHDASAVATLAASLVTAAANRLVLLVGVLDNEVSFEIRSFREYMTARALTTGPDQTVLRSLAPLVPSAHWRNTWLFAAGRVFLEREHLRSSLVALLRQIDNDSLLTMLAAPGAELATDLLDDDLALRAPQYRRVLAEHALERVTSLPDGAWRALADALFEAAEDDLIRSRIYRKVEHARAAGGGAFATAEALLTVWSGRTGILAAHARQLRGGRSGGSSGEHGLLVTRPGEQLVAGPKMRRYLTPYLRALPDPQAQAAMDTLVDALRGIRLLRPNDPHQSSAMYVEKADLPDMELLNQSLTVPAVADAFAEMVDAVAGEAYQVASVLKDLIRYWLGRRPVGHLVGDDPAASPDGSATSS